MNDLNIEPTKSTPEIEFSMSKRLLLIKGRSQPEDVPEFYNPVFKWLEEFSTYTAKDQFQFEFKLEYFNTASAKIIVDLLRKLVKMIEGGKSIQVTWYYEEYDDDMKEVAIQLIEISNIKMEIKSFI